MESRVFHNNQNSVENVLQKSDDVIKSYVDMIVNQYQDEIINLKKTLAEKNINAKTSIALAIERVSNGEFGNCNTEEEAIDRLKKWASGEVETQMNKQVQHFAASMETAGIDTVINPNPKPFIGFDFFGPLKIVGNVVGKGYLMNEEMRRKTNMALEHLQKLLDEKNEMKIEKSNTM